MHIYIYIYITSTQNLGLKLDASFFYLVACFFGRLLLCFTDLLPKFARFLFTTYSILALALQLKFAQVENQNEKMHIVPPFKNNTKN